MRSRVLIVLAVLLAAAGCRSRQPPGQADYAARIEEARATKNRDFQDAANSPVPREKRAEFLPLSYFPIDDGYVVAAALKPSNGREEIEMPTSTGERRRMVRIGLLEFMLKGQPMHLSAFNEVGSADMEHLFVPFADKTSGTETYAAGRYLDLTRTPTGLYEIDFNKAYHPYCYYNPTYDCPFPPPENRLPIPVHAGEKMGKSHSSL